MKFFSGEPLFSGISRICVKLTSANKNTLSCVKLTVEAKQDTTDSAGKNNAKEKKEAGEIKKKVSHFSKDVLTTFSNGFSYFPGIPQTLQQ